MHMSKRKGPQVSKLAGLMGMMSLAQGGGAQDPGSSEKDVDIASDALSKNGSPAGDDTFGAGAGEVTNGAPSPQAPAELAQKPSSPALPPAPADLEPAILAQEPVLQVEDHSREAAEAERKARTLAAMAKGREKRAIQMANERQEREVVFLAHFQEHSWRPKAAKYIAGLMGCSIALVRNLAQATGVQFDQASRNAENPNPGGDRAIDKERKVEEGPGALYKLGWTILQLFDTLLPLFQVVEEDDGEDEDVVAAPKVVRDRRSTWIAWRVFLAAAFGLPASDCEVDWDQNQGTKTRGLAYPIYPGVPEDIEVPRGAANLQASECIEEIYRKCTGREDWPTKQARRVGLMVGRRGGKSYITAIIGIFLACCREYKVNLGTKPMVMILAKDREQAGVIRGYILAFMKAHETLARMLKGEPTTNKIELINGVTIEVRAVSMGGTRGYTVVAVLMDEIAFWPTDEESARQDKKVLQALRPAMMGVKNPMIVMLSSPYARRGVLYTAHKNNYGREAAKVLVWQADTLSMRPTDDPDVIEEIATEYEEDAVSAKAEYGGEFRSDLENIYTQEAIEMVSIQGRIEQAPQTKYRYRAFVDPSGGSSDSYVLAIAHDEDRLVGEEKITIPVLDYVREFVPKFDPAAVSAEVVKDLKRYRIRTVTGDAYGGEWPRDPLQKAGIKYELSEMNRSELYLSFLPLVNSRQCELLDPTQHKRGVNQFANLERRTGRTGKDSIDHPPGAHDDVANAVAGVMTGKAARGLDCTW